MRKRLLSLLFLSSFMLLAQPKNADFWNKVRYGGGIGLGFGNNTFNLQMSPSAIYEVNPYYASGLGLQLNYSKFSEDQFLGYGASWMNFFNPIPSIQLSSELEQWRVSLSNKALDLKDNYWLTSLFIGVGYRSNNVTMGLRYDVLYDKDRSLYADPWVPFIRVYF